jgi:hypothetical protein
MGFSSVYGFAALAAVVAIALTLLLKTQAERRLSKAAG